VPPHSSAPPLPAPDEATFKKWFPGLALSRTACAAPALRVLCFANAGNAEDMYTNEGTGPRRAPSPLLVSRRHRRRRRQAAAPPRRGSAARRPHPSRRSPQEWCREHSAELLAPQYPGRAMRLQEPRVTSAAALAAALLPVAASRLCDVPWVVSRRRQRAAGCQLAAINSALCCARDSKPADSSRAGVRAPCPSFAWRTLRLSPCMHPAVTLALILNSPVSALLTPLCHHCLQLVAHSVGTWVAFEFLAACRAAGVPLPAAAFLSAMPAPDLPPGDRPWRRQRELGEAQFVEECRGWDISEVVFSPAMWPQYQPLLRADFTLFDEYEFGHQGGRVTRGAVVVGSAIGAEAPLCIMRL
jgi:surfactin synthase thioesterase subunit